MVVIGAPASCNKTSPGSFLRRQKQRPIQCRCAHFELSDRSFRAEMPKFRGKAQTVLVILNISKRSNSLNLRRAKHCLQLGNGAF